MKYKEFVAESLKTVPEIFPWDVQDIIEKESPDSYLLLDIREESEYETLHIRNSLSVPRGILEPSADWGFEETQPELVQAREKKVIVICRSGNRSAMAGKTLQEMGFKNVISMKTGVRGWNDNEYELVDHEENVVDIDAAEEVLNRKVPEEKLGPIAVK